MKLDKIKFYLSLAEKVSTQATCPRASVGAVLVNDDRVISVGYNGAPRGSGHCKEEGCWLQPKEDRQSCMKAVHAETNCVLNAAYGGASTKGALLFCTHKPCVHCAKLLINAGVPKVFYLYEYKDKLADELLKSKLIDMELVTFS